MLIGYKNFGGMPDSQFDTRLSPSSFNYVQVQNGVYDEIYADNDTTVPYTIDKKEWGFNTVFLGTFDDTFECGNIQQGDIDIESIRLEKRLKGTLDWIFIDEVLYDKNKSLYAFNDRLAYSLDEYEYAVSSVAQGIVGDPIIDSIICTFEGLWIVDRYESFQMFYDLKYEDVNHVNNINIFELLENKYPMTQSGILNYEKGGNSARIVADKTGRDGVNIDYLGDKKLLDKVVAFFKNGKPKVWKDGYGVKRIVMLSNIKESPHEQTRGGVCKVSFDWTEIGDATSTSHLVNNGLIPEAP